MQKPRRRVFLTSAKPCQQFCLLFLWLFCLTPAWVSAAPGDPLAIRSYNPFTGIFGLPEFPTIAIPADQGSLIRLAVHIVNHADSASSGSESIHIDGETYITEASFHYAINRDWRIGVNLPYQTHRAGFLDPLISDWHKLWGISNTNRRGRDNQLNIRYTNAGGSLVRIDGTTSGFGDARLSVTRALVSKPASGMEISTRITVKIPSGDAKSLLGSGATDVSWDIALHNAQLKSLPDVAVSAHMGVLTLGKGDILADWQKRVVPYGGVSLIWAAKQNFEIIAQLQAQGRYFESQLDELGGTTLQLAAGFRYHLRGSNTAVEFGLIEDLVSDVTPDLAFHLQFSKAL